MSNATWTLEQIRQARRLHASVVVDAELIDRYGEEVCRDAEAEMAKMLADMGHPFGVELSTGVPTHPPRYMCHGLW